MIFSSPIDALQIIFSSVDGKPLTNGKLKLFEVGTSTPKTSFADRTRTTPLGSVLRLDISGRPEVQPFLDYGDYTIEAWRFIGTDPYSVDPNDWAKDHEWQQSGLQALGSNGNAVLTVDTVPDLRAVTGMTNGNALDVLGYTSKGDLFSRRYFWNSADTQSDNLGTVIKNPTISTGSWLHTIEGDVVDVRIFGVLPGSGVDCTTKISNVVSVVQAWSKNQSTLYFPNGTYTVSDYTQVITANVIIDKKVYFTNDTYGGSGYFLTLSGDYTIHKTDGIKLPSSTANVLLKFDNNALDKDVNVRWYGALLDGATDDGASFQAMVSSVSTSNYKLVIDGVMKITTLTSNVVIYNPVVMRNTGKFYMNQTTYTIEFKQPSYIINDNRVLATKFYNPIFYCDRYGVFSNLNKFKFTNVDLYASFFSLNNSAGSTESLHQPFGQLVVSKGTNFYFDMPTANFTASVDTYSSAKFNCIWKSGTLNAISSGTLVKLNNFIAPDIFCIATGKFEIYNNPVKASWFCDVQRTTQQNSDGFAFAVQASLGSGKLDLGGRQFHVTNSISLAPTYSNRMFIYNGDIVYTVDSNPLFNVVSGNIGDIMFHDMVYSSSTDAPFIAMNGSCATLKFNNFTGLQSGTNSFLVRVGSGGNINKTFEVNNSYIEVNELIGNSGNATAVRLNNNEIHLASGTDLRGMRPILANNYIFGTGALLVSCSYAAQVANNFFSELSLYINSVSAVIDGVYNGNTFTSSNALLSDIHLIANEVNTEFKACIIVGNSFTGSQATATEVITSYGTFKTTGASHRLQISGNQSNRAGNLYVPQTEASDWLSLNVPASHPVNEAKLYYRLNYNNLSMFTLPGVSQAPSYINVIPITSTTLATEYGSVISIDDLVNTSGGDGTTLRFSDVGGAFAGGNVSVACAWKIY